MEVVVVDWRGGGVNKSARGFVSCLEAVDWLE